MGTKISEITVLRKQLAKAVSLAELFSPGAKVKMTDPLLIRRCVSIYTGIPEGRMCGSSRDEHIVEARHMAIVIMGRRTGLSDKEIGIFLLRDRTTVFCTMKTMETRITMTPRLQEMYDGINALIDEYKKYEAERVA
jgi:chromosomal replication initiation ATPase DnaA